jgi:hypothetical protein
VKVPEHVGGSDADLTPFHAGQTLNWKLAD